MCFYEPVLFLIPYFGPGCHMKKAISAVIALTSGIILLATALAVENEEDIEEPVEQRTGVIFEIDGPIGPATLDYLRRGIERAPNDGHELIILRMDTPGGLLESTREINKAILNSEIPVVTYVAPSGARAASAGTFIAYASHVAAMAPATSIGAATPVQMGAPQDPEEDEELDEDELEEELEERRQRDQPGSAQERKAIEDAVSYIRSLAERRDRNADWAENAVREAATLSASSALEENVINFVADNLDDLLEQMDGMEVETVLGTVTIRTENMQLETSEPDWRTELLSVLTNPTVAYLLMLIGIYGLIFEGYNPGAIVPGVVGAICLLLALFAFQVLPVNYAGFALIALGLILIISEAFVPSFGVLGIGGLISFVIGSIILMDTDVPGFGIPLPLIAAVSIAGGLITFSIIGFALRARRTPVVSGQEEMVGLTGTAQEDFEGQGRVWVRSEMWRAQCDAPITKGTKVRVTGMDGLVLKVKPLSEDGNTNNSEA